MNNTTLYAIWEKIPVYYEVTANAEEGGTASGGGAVAEGGSVTLTAAANEGYTFEGWYEGEAKVCDTAEFVVENVTADKTYTGKICRKSPGADANTGCVPSVQYNYWNVAYKQDMRRRHF